MKKRGEVEDKAQAALEFLTTDGLAILLVLLAIGSLSYFGVLSPDEFVTGRCILPPGITCRDFVVYDTETSIVLQNNLGEAITIDSISLNQPDGSTCANTDTITLDNGDKVTILIQGCNNGDIGDKFDGEIIIDYTKAVSELSHVSKGDILAKVQGGRVADVVDDELHTLDCSVSTVCPDTVVFKMSALENAHAEIPSLLNYEHMVCCSSTDTLSNSCPGDEIPLHLSADTDALVYTQGNFNADVILEYDANDLDSGVAECSLMLNGVLNQVDDSITEGMTQSFILNDLSPDIYNWYVTCKDDSVDENEGSSDVYQFEVI